MIWNRRIFLASGAAAWATALHAEAADAVLTLRNPALEGAHGEVSFSRADLEAMDWATIETGNEFITGTGTFRGPLVDQVLAMIGRADASQVRLIAANDFFSDVPIAEMAEYGAILAMELDGKPLSPRDFGPIWVMYPMDSHEELQDARYNSRLVWQLQVIELF